MPPDLRYRLLHDVLRSLEGLGVTISELLLFILANNQLHDPSPVLYQDLLSHTTEILRAFFKHEATAHATRSWAQDTVTSLLTEAVRQLTDVDNGWHFSAAQASPEQITEFRIEDMAAKLETCAPELWALVHSLLGGVSGGPMDMDEEDELWAQVDGMGAEGEGGREVPEGPSTRQSRTALIARIVCL